MAEASQRQPIPDIRRADITQPDPASTTHHASPFEEMHPEHGLGPSSNSATRNALLVITHTKTQEDQENLLNLIDRFAEDADKRAQTQHERNLAAQKEGHNLAIEQKRNEMQIQTQIDRNRREEEIHIQQLQLAKIKATNDERRTQDLHNEKIQDLRAARERANQVAQFELQQARLATRVKVITAITLIGLGIAIGVSGNLILGPIVIGAGINLLIGKDEGRDEPRIDNQEGGKP